MNVLFLSPGFPAEMPHFTRGLAEVGVNVIGLGDQPQAALPEMTRRHLSAYVQVGSWSDTEGMLRQVRDVASRVRIDRVESLWELLMLPAAQIREMLGLPGMTVDQTLPFRDKEVMKQRLDAAGIRTPHHVRARTKSECRAAAERFGYPLIIKPIAGAGSMDTYRLDSQEDLERALGRLGHISEVSVEEFVEAVEYTFDTVTVGGQIAYYNIALYRPRPLAAKSAAWISPQTICLRDPDAENLRVGREMGLAVNRVLGVDTAFTHMEWYRREDGEAVFGEIGARPAGARTVDLMNFACDLDLFRGWAEAACHGRFSQPIERKYNCAGIFKRAQGSGIVNRIEGLDRLLADLGVHIVAVELTPIGRPARDWRKSIVGDGFVMLRHPDLQTTLEMADRVGMTLQLHAS